MVRGMKRFVNQPFQMRGIAQENEVFGARKTLQEIGEAFAETMQVAVHRFVRCDEAIGRMAEELAADEALDDR